MSPKVLINSDCLFGCILPGVASRGTGVDEASVVIGDADDIGYQLNATVDFDGEDRVTLRFNTYVAGDETLSEPGAVNAVLIEDGENDAVVLEYAESGAVDGLLDAGDYELAVRAGATDVDDFDVVLDSPDGVGSLFLETQSTESWTLWTAPGGADAIDGTIVETVDEGTPTETEEPAGTPADTPEDTPDDTPAETPEETDDDTPAEETPAETDDDTPGFGIVVALGALLAAALFATRRLR